VKASTWIHRIAHNLCVDAFRRRRESTQDLAPELVPDARADPSAQHAATELRNRLEAALRALPASQRAAIMLCQVQGFSNAEAAQILDVNVRALESLLARARRALKATLFAEEQDDG
jgi:RNA polymerase sigma-70 factor (ECF subfamily)